MIRALFGPSSATYSLRAGLDQEVARHQEIAQRVAMRGAASGSATGKDASEAESPGLLDDMAALADTQIRFEAEATLLRAAYSRLRSAMRSNG